MRRTLRMRRIAKWTAPGLSVLILAAWIISVQLWWISYGTQSWSVSLAAGVFACQTTGPAPYRMMTGWSIRPGFDPRPHFPQEGTIAGLSRRWWLHMPALQRTTYGHHVAVPLWLPLSVATLATGMVFYLDRRRVRPGHCVKCAYDLTANTTGICPECGTKVQGSAISPGGAQGGSRGA